MSKSIKFEGLSDELKATLKGCTTEEELEKALADAGLKLDDDALKEIAGGRIVYFDDCHGNMCKSNKCHDVMLAQSNRPYAVGLASAEMLAASAACPRDICVRICMNKK